MDKKFLIMHEYKTVDRQRWLLGTFVVNLVMIVVVWLLTFIPGIIYLGSVVTGLSAKMTHVAIIGALGLWGVFSFVFWLAPAIAINRSRRVVVEE